MSAIVKEKTKTKRLNIKPAPIPSITKKIEIVYRGKK
jgi:hypothetical protein